jgi:tetratricopeptide (TPR) repeat protein
MSPEQHGGQPADTRTDQFSFAVSLYEGLYGEMPFDGTPEERKDESRWKVRPAPRGSKVPGRVRKVVLKALRPNPTERYSSLTELLDDLSALPGPSRMPYLWAACVLLLAAVLSLGSRLWLESTPPSVGARAGLGLASKTQLLALQKQLEQASALYRTAKLPEALDSLQALGDEAGRLHQRSLEASALLLKGQIKQLADPRHASPELERAAWAAEAAGDDPVAVQAASALVRSTASQDQLEQARMWQGYGTALLERHGPDSSLRAQWQAAAAELLWRSGKTTEASHALDEALALMKEGGQPEPLALSELLVARGRLLMDLGRIPEAREQLTSALQLRQQSLGAQHPQTALVESELAQSYLQEDNLPDARRFLEGALSVLTPSLGDSNLHTLNATLKLGEVELGEGKLDAAQPLFERALSGFEAQLGPANPELALPLLDLGKLALARAKVDQGAPRDAVPLLERALTLLEPNPASYTLAVARFTLAQALGLLHQDTGRARELGTAARDAFHLTHREKEVLLVEAWLNQPT